MKWEDYLVESEESLPKLREKLKRQRKKIVFTAGGFDLIHVGHARYFEKAKEHGDILVAGLNSNKSIQKVKGPHKPILDQSIRAEMLLYLRAVDYVVIINQVNCRLALKLLRPDVFITVGEKWNKGCLESPEAKIVEENGGKVIVVQRQSPKISTTAIMDNIISKQLTRYFKDALKNHRGVLKE
ncbi:MAG: Cytidyltransferase-related protein [uncultured bacterium]|nr:MAG: Cytidyltransferase-related protein [uncultured bacterium]